ncbi:MAG: hypothetical protein ACTFAL_11935 [Candidatus Electronema sp. V4]|uniref:hypothetical protein n=1 Tax=Candidatus Electronema sp. V4 TaxID=3454756 RepID=UPI0040557330
MPFSSIDLSQISDIGLRRTITDGIKQREREIVRLEAEHDKIRQDLAVANTNAVGISRELEFAKARITELLNQIEAGTVVRRKMMKVDQLVSGFRTQIESLNAEAIRKQVGGSMLIENCEVEIKGGLDITDGIQLITLAESALGANTVSTLRFSLRPAPVVHIADDE